MALEKMGKGKVNTERRGKGYEQKRWKLQKSCEKKKKKKKKDCETA